MEKTITGKIINDTCYICAKNRCATIAKITNDETTITVPLCVQCSQLPAEKIWASIMAPE